MNVWMVHICDLCSSGLLFDSTQYYIIVFPHVSFTAKALNRFTAMRPFFNFRVSHLIHHLLQALHHIVDCNSDTHIVLQNDMCHLPWAIRHTRSPFLETWYSIDMPQSRMTFVLEIHELPQTHHSFSLFQRRASIMIRKSLIWMRHPFKHHQIELFWLFGRFLNLFLFL